MIGRRRYRILSFFGIILAAGLILAGCSHKPTTIEIMAKMASALTDAEYMEMDWNLDSKMRMSVEVLGFSKDIEGNLAIHGSTQADRSTGSTYTDGQLTIGGDDLNIAQALEMYTMQEDSQYVNYIHSGSQWIRREGSLSGQPDFSRLSILDDIQELKDSFQLTKEDSTYEGEACYELTAILSPMDLEMLAEEYLAVMHLDEAQGTYQKILNGLDWTEVETKTIRMTLTVDAETFLPRCVVVDLEGRSSDAAESTTAAEEEASGWYDMSYAMTDVDLKVVFSYPEEVSITLPAEIASQDEEETEAAEHSEESLDEVEEAVHQDTTIYREDGSYQLQINDWTEAWNLEEDADAGIRIDLLRVYRDAEQDGKCYADFCLVNGNETDIDLYTRGAAVNGMMIADASLYQTVPAGGSVSCTLTMNLPDTDMEVSSLSVVFESVDTGYQYKDTWNSRLLTVGELPKAGKTKGYVKIMNEKGIRVMAGQPTLEADGCVIPLIIDNNSSANITLDGTGFRSGLNTWNMSFSGVILKSCRLYTTINVDPEFLALLKTEDLPSLSCSLDAFVLESYGMEGIFLQTRDLTMPKKLLRNVRALYPEDTIEESESNDKELPVG